MTQIPHANEPFLDSTGRITRSWRAYLSTLAQSDASAELQKQIDKLWAAINSGVGDGSSSTAAKLQALGSIDSIGTLASGFMSISLDGDAEAPGTTYYYGTDATGAKGWFPLQLSMLADVDSTDRADGRAVIWDATAGKHVYADAGSGSAGGFPISAINQPNLSNFTLVGTAQGAMTLSQNATGTIVGPTTLTTGGKVSYAMAPLASLGVDPSKPWRLRSRINAGANTSFDALIGVGIKFTDGMTLVFGWRPGNLGVLNATWFNASDAFSSNWGGFNSRQGMLASDIVLAGTQVAACTHLTEAAAVINSTTHSSGLATHVGFAKYSNVNGSLAAPVTVPYFGVENF